MIFVALQSIREYLNVSKPVEPDFSNVYSDSEG